MSRQYRTRSPDTWAAARTAFEDGATVPEICARYDLGESAVRARQKKESWRGVDLHDPEPTDPEDDDLPPMDAGAFADHAFHQMTVAARRGRIGVALGWSRLREAALRQALLPAREADRLAAAESRRRRTENNESTDDIIRTMRGVEAQVQAVVAAASIADLAPDELQGMQPLQSSGAPTRAERRRRAALARKRPP